MIPFRPILHRGAAVRPWLKRLAATAAGVSQLAAAAVPSGSAASAAAGGASGGGASGSLSSAPFVQVAAGDYYSTALRADGSVWAWGRTLFGELGALEPRVTSRIDRPVRLAALSGIVSIATNGGGTHVGVKKDGTVWEWGSGSGSTALPKPVQGLERVTAAVPGFALTGDGALWHWTHSAGLEAGQGAEPVRIPGTYRFSRLVADGTLVYGLDSNGAVWGFGTIPRPETSGETVIPPARIAGLPALRQFAASQSQLVGVDASGRVWTARLDTDAIYSHNPPGPFRLTGRPVRVAASLKAAEAYIGDYDSVLIRTTKGELWMTGTWLTGKAGRIEGLPALRAAAAGYHHAVAIDASGRLWGVGGNQWGEAGSPNVNDDRMLYRPVPVLPAISVLVNGAPLSSGYPAALTDGRVSVPLRDTIRNLGGTLAASADGRIAIRLGKSSASVFPGSAQAEVNGTATTLAAPATVISGAVMVPAQLLAQLGVGVHWDAKQTKLSLSR